MQNRNKGENGDSVHLYPSLSCYVAYFSPYPEKGGIKQGNGQNKWNRQETGEQRDTFKISTK